MNLKNFQFIYLLFLMSINFACSSDSATPLEPVERPEVNILTPIDSNGVLNKVEADAVVVEGNSTLDNGYIVTVRISDGKNVVAGTAVVKDEKWDTESISISGFNDGKITVKAYGANEAGSLSNTDEATLYLDQEPPTINIIGPIAENDAINTDEATAVLVKGTSDAANGQMVLITFGDEITNHITTETQVSDGKWQAEVDISSLKSGSLLLMAEVTDIAGNPTTVQRSGVALE